MADEEQTHPAGWYADPWGKSDLRWWDGREWTGHVADQPEAPEPQKTSGFAIASFVLGIVGGSVLAIILGLVARARIAGSDGKLGGKGLATAGIALGALWMAVLVFAVAVGDTGLLEEDTNAKDYRGEQREVAVVVDRFEQYADDERFAAVCEDLFTARWAEAVGDSTPGCVRWFEDELAGRVQAEIDIERITISGSEAEVLADEAGEVLEVSLVDEDGTWRIDRFR